MDDAYHCLHDSINFMKGMPGLSVPRLTAFAVMSLIDTNIVTGNKSQLLDEATELYRRELVKSNKDFLSEDEYKKELKNVDLLEIPTKEKINEYKSKALKEQEKKWEIMKKGFFELRNKYEEIILNSDANKVFGESNTFYECYSQQEFIQLKKEAKTIKNDPPLNQKKEWAKQLALVTNPETIIAVVMSSELGLNMFRTNAAIQVELNNLIERGSVILLKNTKVLEVSKTETFNLKLKIKHENSTTFEDHVLSATQVVNCAGHEGKTFDLQLEHKINWSIDVKGVGIIQLNGDTFCRVPEVYFTQGKGMCHFGRHNNSIAGVNFTTPYVEATYVKDGKVTFSSDQSISLNNSLKSFLETSIIDNTLLERTKRCIVGCNRFMPDFENNVTPLAYLPGALALVGDNLSSRSSKEVYISEYGYHAVNIIKGGGVVSAAMALVQKVEKYTNENCNNSHPTHFPKGSQSPFPQEFVLKYEEQKLEEKIKQLEKDLDSKDLAKAYHSYGK